MGSIYLIRHGQAGTRLSYDQLSDVGRKQAALLGDYLAEQGIRFTSVYSGTLARQRDTASAAARGEIIFDSDWNEFDLEAVYRGIAPGLCRDDARFQSEYDELKRQMADDRSAVHRTWSRCDTTIVRAWVEGKYLFDGESFAAFRERIHRAIARLPECGRDEAIAVFTSATPIAVWIGLALDLDGRRIMQLAGMMQNTAISIVRAGRDGPRLFSFNGVPHLHDAALRSFR